MNASPLVIVLVAVIVMIAMVVHVTAPDGNYIPKHWVDPNDMRNYDRRTKTMKNADTCSAKGENCPPPKLSEPTDATDEVNRYKVFLERFINRFLLAAHLHVRY